MTSLKKALGAAQSWRAWRYRLDFLCVYSRATLEVQHASTVLGRFWLLVPPVFTAGILFVLVTILGVRGAGSSQYLLHILAGVLLFSLLTNAATTMATSLTGSAPLIRHTRLPSALLPLSAIVAACRRFAPALLILVPLAMFFSYLEAPLIPRAILALGMGLATVAGFGFLAATVNVIVPDVGKIVPLVMRILLYTSPVLFTYQQVQASSFKFLEYGPFFWPVVLWSSVFDGEQSLAGTNAWVMVLWPVISLAVGIWIFFYYVPRLTKYL